MVIDSDGEEDEESSGTSLRENDLVALINQLPLASLFSALSLIDDKRPKVRSDSKLVCSILWSTIQMIYPKGRSSKWFTSTIY